MEEDIENKLYALRLYLIISSTQKFIEVADTLTANNLNLFRFDLGDSLIILAADVDNTDIVKYLLNRGVDINHQNDYGTTALMYACNNHSSECVKLLLENGADIQLEHKLNMDKFTAKDLAKYKKCNNILKNLEEYEGCEIKDPGFE